MSRKEEDSIVYTSKFDNSRVIKIEYENENLFNKYIKSLKKYNMPGYKEFIFNVTQKLKNRTLVGDEIGDGIYRVDLCSSKTLSFVHGDFYLTYRLEDNYKIILISIEPSDFLLIGHSLDLPAYKGIPITGPKDRFKVDLYNAMRDK